MRRKEERSKHGQTNKAKQHSTPKAVTFPKKNELPRVGLEHMYTLYMCGSVLTHLSSTLIIENRFVSREHHNRVHICTIRVCVLTSTLILVYMTN